jgi:hypothetical protein
MGNRLFLKFAVAIWCVYAGFSLGYFSWNYYSTRESYERKNRAELVHQARSAKVYLENNQTKELVEVLRHSVRTGLIDSFAWKKSGDWVASEGEFPFPNVPAMGEQPVDLESGVVVRVPGKEMDLYLANRFGFWERVRESWLFSASFFLKELLFFTISFGFMVGILFRDFFRAYVVAPKEILELGAKTQIAPKSLRKKRKLEATEEECIFVTIAFRNRPNFEEVDPTKKFQTNKEEMRELAERYGGVRVEDYCLGSTFQFPDLKLAVSFARDYSICEHTILLNKGWGVRFGSETVLSETVVQSWKKIQNLEKGVWIWEQQQDSLFQCRPKMGIAEIHQFLQIESFLNKMHIDWKEEFCYFRNDRDLTKILEELRASHWDNEGFLRAVAHLKDIQFGSQSTSVMGAYTALLKKEMAGKDPFRLSAVISIAPNIFHQDALQRDLELCLLEILEGKEKRPKSNVIEVFIYFSPDREIPGMKSHLRDFDNRVSANAIVKLALERFDDSLVRKMEERLHGGSVAHVASALYALGEIAYYYRDKNPDLLSKKVEFLRLFQEIPSWVQHPNSMVRRQAIVAAKKLSDPELDQKLKRILESSPDQAVHSLFESVYGWKNSNRSAA